MIWSAFVSWALGKCCWNPSTHRKTLPQPGQPGSILRATQPPYFPRAKSCPDAGFSEISQTVLEKPRQLVLLLAGLDSGKLVNGSAGNREGTAGERLRREAEERSRCLDRGRTGKASRVLVVGVLLGHRGRKLRKVGWVVPTLEHCRGGLCWVFAGQCQSVVVCRYRAWSGLPRPSCSSHLTLCWPG